MNMKARSQTTVNLGLDLAATKTPQQTFAQGLPSVRDCRLRKWESSLHFYPPYRRRQ